MACDLQQNLVSILFFILWTSNFICFHCSLMPVSNLCGLLLAHASLKLLSVEPVFGARVSAVRHFDLSSHFSWRICSDQLP